MSKLGKQLLICSTGICESIAVKSVDENGGGPGVRLRKRQRR
jgi:hypothetical protein